MPGNEKKTEVLKFRSTKEQRYELNRRALDYGFSSVSAYILWATLEEDHTEGGAAALSASLEKIERAALASMEKIREADTADREKLLAAIEDAGKKNARKIEEVLDRFEEERRAAHAADKQREEDRQSLIEVIQGGAVVFVLVMAAVLTYKFFIGG